MSVGPSVSVAQDDRGVCDIGSRLELFVDDWLIDSVTRIQQKLHHPTPREIALSFDKPWEGSTCCYVTVFKDGDKFRMYYRGSNYDVATQTGTHPELACYAESEDGIHWTRPNLGIYEFEGSTDNNIVWMGPGAEHNLTPFKDENPACAPDAKYKAVGTGKGGLAAFKSPDGLHWKVLQEAPIITLGDFDSQNLAFWDPVEKRYVDFHRRGRDGVRDIMTAYSDDFVHWTEPTFLEYGDAPKEHLYTNAITRYPRAPHIFMGFPKRFVPNRQSAVHPVKGVSDGVFMTSRDGVNFKRWQEALIRPGLQPERWINRNNMTAWGVLITEPAEPGLPQELSIFSSESYYVPGNRLRRFTMRLDGFVSMHAGYPGGQFVTKPLTFQGASLALNYATSAAGTVQVELQDAEGKPIPGFEMDKCKEMFGDEIAGKVTWEDDPDLSALAGAPVRLRFRIEDADLYAMQFGD